MKATAGDSVAVRNLVKTFCYDPSGDPTLKLWLVNLIRRKPPALKQIRLFDDISFNVGWNENVGLIGCNGSGKTSLLNIICGIYQPDRGSVVIAKRVTPLLSLNSGFDGLFSGYENIYLHAALLGIDKYELQLKLADIIGFSGLGEHLERPLATYSQGMLLRLGFAIAVHSNPELMLIDEVIEVGDDSFKARCERKLLQLIDQGVNIMLASHNTELIKKYCPKTIWLDRGKIVMFDDTAPVIAAYHEFQKKQFELEAPQLVSVRP